MRAINKTDLEIGNNDIPICIYSAVEKETGFKQFSSCCRASINQKRVCSDCGNEVDFADIKKGIELDGEFKEVDTENLKTENTSLKILGYLDGESEENGVFKDGSVWFISPEKDKKNKSKTERALLKFSYIREVCREFEKGLLCLISVRGKEHIVLLKPYFNGFVGLGVYHCDRIRDINELAIADCEVNPETRDLMGKKLISEDKMVGVKNIENKREQMIQKELISPSEKPKQKEENVIELMNF